MSQAYTLRIAIDDSKLKDLESRIQNLLGIKGGQSSASKTGAGGALGGNSAVAKNILKLGAIAVGVGGILSLTKKIADMSIQASPVLQSMLKLLNTGIMFMLRPIGDFIGFFLRPIMVFFIRNIALPMYRTWSPIMRQLGTWLGNSLVKDPVGTIAGGGGLGIAGVAIAHRDEILSSVTGFLGVLSTTISGWANILSNIIFPDVPNFIRGVIEPFLFNLSSLFDVLLNGFITTANANLIPAMNSVGQFFTSMATGFTTMLTNNVLPIIQGIGGFFQVILNNLTGEVATTWNAIVKFFTDLAENLAGLPALIWDSLTSLVGGGGNTNNVTNNNNFQLDINANGIDDLTEAEDTLSSFINNIVQGLK